MRKIEPIGQHYLYRHIRLDKNEPFYIGIGTKSSQSSLYNRACNVKSRSNGWKDVISQTDYEIEIILESDNYDFIKQKEIEFIALYGRIDLGTGILVNLTDGGQGCHGISKEARDKRSERMKGNKHLLGHEHTIETKLRIGLSGKGKNTLDENPAAKMCVHIDSGKVFTSLKEGCSVLKLDYDYEKDSMRRINCRNPKFYWVNDTCENIARRVLHSQGIDLLKKTAIHFDSGIAFDSIKEGCEYFKLDCEKERSRIHNKYPQSNFYYLGDYFERVYIERFNVFKTSNNPSSKSCIHIKTNKKFNSLKEGCDFFNLSYSTQKAALYFNYKTKEFYYE